MLLCLLLHVYAIALMCTHNGLRYETGTIIEPNCTTRCTCQEGHFDCIEQMCIANGSTCFMFGYGHYQTFDMNHFDFHGSCEYVLTQPCHSSNFTISAGSSTHDSFVAFPNFVRIIIPTDNLEILLGRDKLGGTIMINDVIHVVNEDQVVLQSDSVKVIRIQGSFHVLLIMHHVEIFWDGLYRVIVTADSLWEDKLCGLCGNYNNDLRDDFKMSNGNLTSVVNEFGSSWLFGNTTLSCSVTSFSNSCQASDLIKARARCNELLSSVFNACNNAINPAPYISSCIFDFCSCNETDRENFYCNGLAAYAAACATKGIVIHKWRKAFCRK